MPPRAAERWIERVRILLKMRADRQPAFDGLALNSAQYIHLIAQIEDRVFADRQRYSGDPRGAGVARVIP